MKRYISNLIRVIFFLLVSINVTAQQTSLTIDNQSPGWLSSKIGYGDQQTVENLKVIGYINSEDLKFISTLASKHSLHGILDLEDANIVGETPDMDNYMINSMDIFGNGGGSHIVGSNDTIRLQFFSYPKTLRGGEAKAFNRLFVDTLFINTTKFIGALQAKVNHIKMGEDVTIINYPSLKDLSWRGTARPYIESIEFPSTLKEINGKKNSSTSYSTIECTIKDGKYFKEFPSIEKLIAGFFVEEMPDSVFLPNIKVLSLDQYHTYNSSKMFKAGMHVFIGEKIDTLTEMSHAKNIHLHFASPNPPVMEGSIVYHSQLDNMSYFKLHVPKGSADAYRACFKDGGTDVTIFEETIDVSEVTLNKHEHSLNVGETYSLSVSVSPDKATDKSIKWGSENSEIAEVNSTGIVKAKKAGDVLITASSVSNPEVKDVCKITVIQPATGIQISETSLTLIQNKETKSLTATINPDDTTDKTVLWSSDDTGVAEVDKNGIVTAKKAGKCTITATAKSNVDAKATCEVTVIQPVTGITLSEPSLTMTYLTETIQLTANVWPEDATNKAVKWLSSDISVCSVSDNGTVVATGYGQASVVATTVDGGFPAACLVKVIDPTEIKSVALELDENVRIYDVWGNRNNTLKRGLNIVKMSDGTTKKVVVK